MGGKAIRVYFMYIIRLIKAKRTKEVEHVAPAGEKRNAHKMSVKNPERNRIFGRSKIKQKLICNC
jgi:hypothetical protein